MPDAATALDAATPVTASTVTPDAAPQIIGDAILRGTVKDKNGAPWGGVAVTVAGGTPYSSRWVVTNNDGEFEVPGLTAGRYGVTYAGGSGMGVIVVLKAKQVRHLKLVATPIPEPTHCCKPYGAPPARRRVV